mgnify:CR=1 FL=1
MKALVIKIFTKGIAVVIKGFYTLNLNVINYNGNLPCIAIDPVPARVTAGSIETRFEA